MPARVLIVTGDTEVERTLSEAMRAEGHEVLKAVTGHSGFLRWGVERPDLMVLDAEVAGIDGYTVAEQVRQTAPPEPHMPIVIFGADADVEAKARAIKSGADEYLAKPVRAADVMASMGSLLVRFRRDVSAERDGAGRSEGLTAERGHGRIHAFYGAKGGVGTTTVAINTAVSLHRVTRRQVCLVDADLQFGDHRVFLDLGPDGRSLADAAMSPTIDGDLLRHLVVRHKSGIDALLAPPTPESAEQLVAQRQPMKEVMEALRLTYDHIVVDLDRRLDDHSLDVITSADNVFVVMTADLSCIKNVRLTLETLSQIGVPSDRVQLFLNRSTAYTGITPKAVEQVLRRPVLHRVVNDYRTAISALNTGDPFMMNRVDSALGRSLVDFVHHVDGQTAPAPVVQSAKRRSPRLLPALTST